MNHGTWVSYCSSKAHLLYSGGGARVYGQSLGTELSISLEDMLVFQAEIFIILGCGYEIKILDQRNT